MDAVPGYKSIPSFWFLGFCLSFRDEDFRSMGSLPAIFCYFWSCERSFSSLVLLGFCGFPLFGTETGVENILKSAKKLVSKRISCYPPRSLRCLKMMKTRLLEVDGINELYQGEVVEVERKFQALLALLGAFFSNHGSGSKAHGESH